MKQRRLTALLIEADPEDALQILELARLSTHLELDMRWERSVAGARKAISDGFDAILLGVGPNGLGLEAIESLDAGADTAIVVIACDCTREAAVRSIRCGAEDQLGKKRLTAGALERSLHFAVERTRAKAALRVAEAEYRGLFENALEGVYRSSPDGQLLAANPALVQMLGYESKEELLKIDLREIYVNPTDRERWLRRLENRDEIRNSEAMLRRRDGEAVIALETTRAVRAESGDVMYFEGTLLDITERKHYERHLEYLVSHDSLTGLYSRRRFVQDLEREVERCRRYQMEGAVLWIDLDKFKEVNDGLGHHAGDEVLMMVGRLLKKRLRQTDVVARMGGDEFAVLAPQANREQAEALAAGILETLWNGPIDVEGKRVQVGASIGIALISESCRSAEQILAQADQAMYRAKAHGGHDSRVHVPPSDEATARIGAGELR